MTKGILAWAAALALGLSGMAGAEPFRLIVTHLEPPLVPNSVMDMAQSLGYFEREGVEVELVRVQQTPSAVAALQAGEGEMANIGTDALLQLTAAGNADLVAVASPNKSLPFLIAARDGIDSPEALKGHSFGVGRIGSLDHSLSTAVLDARGVAMDDLDVVSLGQPSVRAQALLAGRVDATTMSIGVWLSLPDHDGIHVLVDADAYYAAAPVVTKVNVVPRAVLESRGADVEKVLTALTKASRDFAANGNAWIDGMAAALDNVSRDTLAQLADAYAGSWSVNGGLQKDELEFTQDWIYRGPDFQGVASVTLADWVDFGPMDAVLADLGTAEGMDPVSR